MPRSLLLAAIAPLVFVAVPAAGQEVFTGAYVHGVDTPFTLPTGERAPDIEFGYRFGRQDALRFIGRPAPYLLISVNTGGETSFAGAGLSWKIGKGPVYLRPGVGLVAQNGPRSRVGSKGLRTDLGSPVLFEPELAIGTRLTDGVSLEASWVHISNARLFNRRQNPGIDMMGLRLAFRVK